MGWFRNSARDFQNTRCGDRAPGSTSRGGLTRLFWTSWKSRSSAGSRHAGCGTCHGTPARTDARGNFPLPRRCRSCCGNPSSTFCFPHKRRRSTNSLHRAAPFVILAVGSTGVGKTTTVAKLTQRFRQQGKTLSWLPRTRFVRQQSISSRCGRTAKVDVIRHRPALIRRP